jgi:hypothetical protein
MARRETVRSAAKLFPALRWLNEFPKVHDGANNGAALKKKSRAKNAGKAPGMEWDGGKIEQSMGFS